MLMLKCPSCQGERVHKMSTGGRLSDWVAVECRECAGTGETPATADEIAELDAMTAATVAEIERDLGAASAAPIATPMPMPVHSNMTTRFFDAAVNRAHQAELSISRTDRASVVAVSSGTDDDHYYTVDVDYCNCIAGQRLGHCYHRAYYCFMLWLEACDAVAIAAHQSVTPVTLNFPVAA